jgi:hypothetical protein
MPRAEQERRRRLPAAPRPYHAPPGIHPRRPTQTKYLVSWWTAAVTIRCHRQPLDLGGSPILRGDRRGGGKDQSAAGRVGKQPPRGGLGAPRTPGGESRGRLTNSQDSSPVAPAWQCVSGTGRAPKASIMHLVGGRWRGHPIGYHGGCERCLAGSGPPRGRLRGITLTSSISRGTHFLPRKPS